MSGEPGAADQKATEPRGHCPSATSSCAWGQMPLQGAGPAPLALGKATALPVCEVPTEPEPEGLQDNQADPLVLASWPRLCRWLVQRQFGRVLDLLLPVWRDPVRDPGDSPSPSVGGAARNRGATSSRGNGPSLCGHGAPPPGRHRALCRGHTEAQPCPPGTDNAVRTARKHEKLSTRRGTGQGEAAEGRREHRQQLLTPDGHLRPKLFPSSTRKLRNLNPNLA